MELNCNDLQNLENLNIGKKPIRVLLAPLDWGLGHASRCIPLINKLLSMGISVTIASSGPPATLLQEAFPGTVILPLEGYKIHYQGVGGRLWLTLLKQIPQIKSAINKEKKWLAALLKDKHFDAVISDNRYGFFHASIPSVFITHQLRIQTGFSIADSFIQKWHYAFIQRFDTCWVPDVATSPSFAGILSHPKILPALKVQHIGLLSRFKRNPVQPLHPLCILLSGPEPQRSIFENELLKQIKQLSISVILIRGLPDTIEKLDLNLPHLNVYNHLPSDALQNILEKSAYVLARSGYSSVMDLLTIGVKTILVPTPGQTEQQYLATHLLQGKYAYTCNQEHFSLSDALAEAKRFDYRIPDEMRFQENIIEDWAGRLGWVKPPEFR